MVSWTSSELGDTVARMTSTAAVARTGCSHFVSGESRQGIIPGGAQAGGQECTSAGFMLCLLAPVLRIARSTDVRAAYVRDSCLCSASSFLGLRSPYASCIYSLGVRWLGAWRTGVVQGAVTFDHRHFRLLCGVNEDCFRIIQYAVDSRKLELAHLTLLPNELHKRES